MKSYLDSRDSTQLSSARFGLDWLGGFGVPLIKSDRSLRICIDAVPKFQVPCCSCSCNYSTHTSRAELSRAPVRSGLGSCCLTHIRREDANAVGVGVGGHSQKLKIDVIKTPKQTQTETSNLPRQFQLESNLISSCSSSIVAA